MQICPALAKAPNTAALTAASISASSSTISGALPPSSSRTGFRCSAAELGDHLADPGRAGEVHPLDRRMGDQRRHDLRRVVGRVGDHIDDALGKAGLVHDLADQTVGRRADFRRLEDHRVAAGERRGDRAHAQDHRRVPRRDAEHDAGRLPDRERNHARLVGRDDLAGDLGGERPRPRAACWRRSGR